MPSFGLSLAEGKRVYDVEQQRRAEMETYQRDETLRAAQRRIGLAQARMAETQAGIEEQKGREFLSADAKETRKIQQSVDKLKVKTDEILRELGPTRAKQVRDAFNIVSKYQSRIQSDPQAVVDALNEQGFEGFTLVADRDGWANGIKIRNNDTGAEMQFANPDQALLALHRHPVDAALAHAQAVETSNVKQREKLQELRFDLAKINAKTQGDLLVAEAGQARDPKKLIEGYDLLAMQDAGLVKDKVTGTLVDAKTGAAATDDQYSAYQKSFKDAVAAGASDSPVRAGLYSAVRAESSKHLAEINMLREQKMLDDEVFKRRLGKETFPSEQEIQRGLGSSNAVSTDATRAAADQIRAARGAYPGASSFQAARPMTAQEAISLETDIQAQYPQGTPRINRGLGQITQ